MVRKRMRSLVALMIELLVIIAEHDTATIPRRGSRMSSARCSLPPPSKEEHLRSLT